MYPPRIDFTFLCGAHPIDQCAGGGGTCLDELTQTFEFAEVFTF